MDINLNQKHAAWLTDQYNNGVGRRETRKSFEALLNEELDFKVKVFENDIIALWTSLGLDPEKQPKVKKTFNFVLVTSSLSEVPKTNDQPDGQPDDEKSFEDFDPIETETLPEAAPVAQW